jgi:peptide/nickel transport system substrate-binding protein
MRNGYWTGSRTLNRRRVLAATLTTGAAVACSGSKQPASRPASGTAAAVPLRGGTLTLGLASDIANLDPLKSSLLYDRQIQYHLYDSLLATTKSLDLVPALATSWETADPTSLILHLRQGVQFHDGTDFNAEAVKFNLDRILQTPASPRAAEVAGVTAAQAVDPTTVKLTLKAPFSPLLAQFVDRAGMILSPAAVQKQGDNLTFNPVGAGTGAFKFMEYKKDDHLTLTRNDAYWGKDASGAALPYLNTLVYRPIVDETQRLNSLKAGEIDFSDTIAEKDVKAFKSDPALTYAAMPALSFNGFWLNGTQEPFRDLRVRQALAWSIDRQQIVQTIYYNIDVVSNGPIAPPQFPYDSNYHPYTRDINKAKALLAQAGQPSVTFSLLTQAGSAVAQQYAELVKDQVKDAGFTVNIQELDFPTLVANLSKHQFQAGATGWSGRLDPDGNTYGQFHSGGGNNYAQYTSAEMDKALDAARQTFDPAQRKPLYQQVNRLAAEDAPYIFTHHQVSGQYSTVKVKHFTVVPDMIYRFHDVWKQA